MADAWGTSTAPPPAAPLLLIWVGELGVAQQGCAHQNSKWQDKPGLALICVSLDSCGLDLPETGH